MKTALKKMIFVFSLTAILVVSLPVLVVHTHTDIPRVSQQSDADDQGLMQEHDGSAGMVARNDIRSSIVYGFPGGHL